MVGTRPSFELFYKKGQTIIKSFNKPHGFFYKTFYNLVYSDKIEKDGNHTISLRGMNFYDVKITGRLVDKSFAFTGHVDESKESRTNCIKRELGDLDLECKGKGTIQLVPI